SRRMCPSASSPSSRRSCARRSQASRCKREAGAPHHAAQFLLEAFRFDSREEPDVPMDTTADFDLGPLSWVQSEIDQALARGLDALAVHRDTADNAALKHARAHIHQAAGAIQMVGLDAVVAFTDEIERQ